MPDFPKNHATLSKGFGALLILAIILASLNLRPAVTSLGALLDLVIDDLQMNGFVAGMITGVPPLCFALMGPLAPRLAGKRGPELVVAAAMAAVLLGIALRAVAPGTGFFLLCTTLALAGIAVGNILMPVLVKRWFPGKIGIVTGAYTTAVALGASGVAGIAVPVNQMLGGNWRLGLGFWAILALLALMLWLLVYFGMRNQIAAQQQLAGIATDGAGIGPMRKNATAWWVALFFGGQSAVAYIFMGWLPKIFIDFGVSPAFAGSLLAILLGVGVPLSFVMPALAAKFSNQAPLVIFNGVVGIIAIIGMLLAPVQGAVLWAVLLGICGSNFPLALTMIGLKARTAAGVSKLSTFGQSAGYLMAFPGPFLVGVLHETSGSWVAPIWLIAGLIVFQTLVGIMAGRPRYIEDTQLREVR
ncbi:CynX/NimT family MFS transporter [Glutamicibacter nicotianae]|uniref:CynX/NimT family MFS transporter n=1 Tax=Glutamicibacter nicotianae TaxID=37929 RepID=UPI001FC99DED|nr:MFS transporter [Glutamicibacter nicotianae]